MALTAERLHPSERGIRYFEHIKRYLFSSGFVKGKKVLDAACGTGYGSSLLMKSGASNVHGIDISDEAVRFASHSYHQKGLSFSQMDVANMKLGAGSFDVVVSFETLEHVEDYKGFLSECRRVLKPKGTLIISTPNRNTFGCGLEKPFVKYHVKEFELNGFRRLLEESRFIVDRIYGQRLSRRFSWFYRLRCLVVRFPLLGRFVTSRYQDSLRSSDKKPDDFLVSGLMPLFGIRLSLSDIIISDKTLDRAIYFIAVCRKS